MDYKSKTGKYFSSGKKIVNYGSYKNIRRTKSQCYYYDKSEKWCMIKANNCSGVTNCTSYEEE